MSPAWRAHVAADHHPYRKDCDVCLQAASRDRPHFRQSDLSFYSLSADISGPFAPGKDVGGKKRYFVAFAIRLPVGEEFPWAKRSKMPQEFPKGSEVYPAPRARTPPPVSGPSARVSDPYPSPCLPVPVPEDGSSPNLYQDLEEDSVSEPVKAGCLPPPRRVRGKSSPVKQSLHDFDEPVDLEMEFSRDGVPDLHPLSASSPVSAPNAVALSSPADFLADPASAGESHAESCALNREFVTLRWAEPLKNRSADNLRLAIMQSIAKCKAFGVPVLRFHTDRAKEFQSAKLLRWLAEQSIHSTKSAPEDPQANGTAESAVKELKRAARRSLISSGLTSNHWPLAIRQASELLWRAALSQLGCPTRALLAFGTRVQARSREWLKRSDKQWGQRTLPGRLVGPAPQTPSAYVVLLDDAQLYISSSVHPVSILSDSVASADALPSCEVQLKLCQASSQDSCFSLPPVSDLPSFAAGSTPSLCALRASSPFGGGIRARVLKMVLKMVWKMVLKMQVRKVHLPTPFRVR